MVPARSRSRFAKRLLLTACATFVAAGAMAYNSGGFQHPHQDETHDPQVARNDGPHGGGGGGEVIETQTSGGDEASGDGAAGGEQQRQEPARANHAARLGGNSAVLFVCYLGGWQSLAAMTAGSPWLGKTDRPILSF